MENEDKLGKIGFYTLSDERVRRVIKEGIKAPLWRCEILLTDACNFKCTYCRGLPLKGTLPFKDALHTLDLWILDGLKNVRFSGGEPTLYNGLETLVDVCRLSKVDRIAVSSNGSNFRKTYERLLFAGVNDFSISLDSCCADTCDKVIGVSGFWDVVVDNIKFLASETYTTIGLVVTQENANEAVNTVNLGKSLGVSDIRVIPAAQDGNNFLRNISEFTELKEETMPILKYRLNNMRNKRPFRGLQPTDNNRCPLVLDDMIVLGTNHYPCPIYVREQGNPIGKVGSKMREDRLAWYEKHDTYEDNICRKNCLDICVDYNNRFKEFLG